MTVTSFSSGSSVFTPEGDSVHVKGTERLSPTRTPRIFPGRRRNVSNATKSPEVNNMSLSVEASPAFQATTETGTLASISPSLLPRAPPPSLSNRMSRTSELRASLVAAAGAEPAARVASSRTGGKNSMTFDELLVGCIAMLGVPGGVRARESLRRVLKAWSEDGDRHDCDDGSRRPTEAARPRRSRQRPSLPLEARGGTSNSTTTVAGHSATDRSSSLLAVRGSQMDSSANNDRRLAVAEAAAARWEKRYNQQASATEKALLETRNAKISLREVERVLGEERADAARAAREAAEAAAEAAEALRERADAQDEKEGGLTSALSESAAHSLQSMAVRERCEKQLRQRLQLSQAKLAEAETEIGELRKAVKAAEKNRSLQPVVVSLGEILKECLASMGLVRGVPDGEFHAMVSVLRDRAEKAATGFLSVEGLHAAAEGARAIDAIRGLRVQLQEALLDASRQRARRVSADARVKEKETGEMERSFGKEELLKARKETSETRARLAVADAEVKQLKKSLKEEQERLAAAWAATRHRSAPIADVRGIFDEGHRLVQEKMKLKAQQIQQEVSQMQQDISEARLREVQDAHTIPPMSRARPGTKSCST